MSSAAAPTVNCPSVADKLPQIPAAANAEVQQNLNLLKTQIDEANRRIVTTEGQGGPNFIQNAILGPLADKRLASLNRIATAIARTGAARPDNLQGLAKCALNNAGQNGGNAGGQNGGNQNGGNQNGGQAGNGQNGGNAGGQNGGQNGGQAGNGQNGGNAGGQNGGNQNGGQNGAAPTVNCPPVADRLGQIPAAAQAEVQRNLDLLDTQIQEANRRLAATVGQGGRNFIQNAILGPLAGKRLATLNRISTAIARTGAARPQGLLNLVRCTLNNGGGNNGGDNGGNNGGNNGGATPAPSASASPSASPTGGAGGATGPSPEDFVDIRRVQPNVNRPQVGANGSRGSFITQCGRNENGHFNSDNVIVAPGVTNGAHHVHDYVGNLDNNGFSTNDSLKAAGTTCRNGDKSSHFWPVLRLQNQRGNDADKAGGGLDGNIGRIVRPASVTLKFGGNPQSKVVAMPELLRIITGDAKSFTNGTTNANASWSCTGFENRQLKDKYPICPRGSQVVRTFNFQSCWDGQNIDSANHRTHVAFAAPDGACPAGFQAIPALQQRITYNVPPGPGFAVDSFPEQLHKPVTDHGDFINVMPEALMKRAVDCINTGRRC
ncbi:hypothetical protein Sru01_53110 [Sphaerisporangium rufum]|uniref:DUF1996 domain-containing protein n=1 Tax=Sphaerisporangium rufum TaxID=1381558 RepID=A0A919R6D2_9ACTN|nr:hypothetical protein Sru01_53110 [Sphaerisporangium rufum]